MKYFVIYPGDAPQQLDHFKTNNNHLDIEIIPIQTLIPNQDLRDELLKDQIITHDNIYDLTNLALTKAHISLWQKVIKTDTSITIFEAGSIAHKDFLTHQQHSLSLKADYDLFIWGYNLNWNPCIELMPSLPKIIYTFLGYGEEELKKNNNDLINVPLYQNSNINTIQTLRTFSFSGLGCYSISPAGAKQLLDKIQIIGNDAAPTYQEEPHGTNFYVFNKLLKRDNISLDIEVNRHIEFLNTYMTIPMLAVIPTEKCN